MTSSGEDVYKNFIHVDSETIGGNIYISFLLNVSSAQDGGDYFLHLAPSTIDTVFLARVFAKKDADGYNLGISKSTINANYSKNRLVYGTTYNVVVKYTFNNNSNTDDVVELFVNQIPNYLIGECNNPEPSATVKCFENELDPKAGIGNIVLRQGTSSIAPILKISNIVIGESWGIVAMCLPNALPIVGNYGSLGTLTIASNGDKFKNYKTQLNTPSDFINFAFAFANNVDSLSVKLPEGFEISINPIVGTSNYENYQKSLYFKNNTKDWCAIRLSGEKVGKFSGYLTFESKNKKTVRLKLAGEVLAPPITATEPSSEATFFKVSPNPSDRNARIMLPNLSTIVSPISMKLFTIDGKLLTEKTGSLEEINEEFQRKINQKSATFYLLHLQMGQKNGVIKVITE